MRARGGNTQLRDGKGSPDSVEHAASSPAVCEVRRLPPLTFLVWAPFYQRQDVNEIVSYVLPEFSILASIKFRCSGLCCEPHGVEADIFSFLLGEDFFPGFIALSVWTPCETWQKSEAPDAFVSLSVDLDWG